MSNSNKKIIVVSSPTYEHLEDLFKDGIVKGDNEACYWFNYVFYDDPCGRQVIYTNFWNIADLRCN